MVNKEKVQIKKNEIQFKVKELYFGHLLAANYLDFINDGIKDIETAKESIQKSSKNKKDDLSRLVIFENLLRSRKEEVANQFQMSIAAIKYYIQETNPEVTITLAEKWLELERRELKDFNYYYQLFLENRPELKQLENGIKAKERLYKATRKSLYPITGLFMNYQFSNTNARQPQESVYAYDPYNENSLVAGLGFIWNLDFGITKNNAAKHNIESQQLKMKRQNAIRGLGLLMRKNWSEIQALKKSLKASKKALKNAKKLLNRSLMKGAVGLINARDVVEAYQARVLTFNDFFQKVHDYNLAWSNLSMAVGIEVDPFVLKQKK